MFFTLHAKCLFPLAALNTHTYTHTRSCTHTHTGRRLFPSHKMRLTLQNLLAVSTLEGFLRRPSGVPIG